MAEPLNIDKLLENSPKNRVARVGVELEGGWERLPPGINRLEHDGSVFRDNYELLRAYPQDRKSGELSIGPMQPGALTNFMKKYYPHKVDHTCGMHVHMSFKSLLHFAWLEVPEYQETIISYLSAWAEREETFPAGHQIWGRLKGMSNFCQKQFWPDLQACNKGKDHNQERPGHRYTIVNYCGRYHTIEVRVLPMMETVDQGIRAVKQVIAITNACLMVLKQKEGKVGEKLVLPDGQVYEDYIEEEIPLTSGERKRLFR